MKKSTFAIKEVNLIKHIFNNKTNTPIENKLQLLLIGENGQELTINIKGSAKSDNNKFQEALNEASCGFLMTFGPKEFKAIMVKFVYSKINKKIIIYENAGVIGENQYLGDDFLIDNNNIYFAQDGLIPTSKSNVFIVTNKNTPFYLPKLYQSDKPIETIVKDLLCNVYQCFGNNKTSALLILGHMVMGIFYEYFIKTIGVPMLIISGVSGCGKSTIVQIGNALFGLGEDFLNAGNSTINSQLLMSQTFNGGNTSIDDMSEKYICSSYFGQNIKNHYNGTARAKCSNYGKEIILVRSCSQQVISTNSALPDIPELQNRANIINMFEYTINTDEFRYFSENEDNRKELSNILIELMKINIEDVLELHKTIKEELANQISTSLKPMPRVLHNIAYMVTGLRLLEKIGNCQLNGIKDSIIKYANETIEKYNGLPTPIDMLLNGLLTLKNHRQIEENLHYKIDVDNNKVLLTFHKDTLLSAYNRFFTSDDRKIDDKVFRNYLKCDKRIIQTRATGYYSENPTQKRKSSIIMDITQMIDLVDFIGYTPNFLVEKCNKETLSEVQKIIGN